MDNIVNFIILDKSLGQHEGKELEKVLYSFSFKRYRNLEERLFHSIGLVEAVVKLTSDFLPNKPCEFIRTRKLKYILNECTKDIWSCLIIKRHSNKINNEKEILEMSCRQIMKTIFHLFELFNGNINNHSLEKKRKLLKEFFDKIFKTLIWNEILTDVNCIFRGIQFHQLLNNLFLNSQSICNELRNEINHKIKSVFLVYNNQVIWSDFNQVTSVLLYQFHMLYTISDYEKNYRNLKDNEENLKNFNYILPEVEDVDGINCSFSRIFYSSNEKEKKEEYKLFSYDIVEKIRIYFITSLDINNDEIDEMELFIERNFSALLLMLEGRTNKRESRLMLKRTAVELNRSIYNPLLNPKKVSYRFFYINHLNMAQRSAGIPHPMNFHSYLKHDNQSSVLSDESQLNYLHTVICRLKLDLNRLGHHVEIMEKLGNNCWVIAKKYGERELYILITDSNYNLTEIDNYVRSIFQESLRNIFFLE
ncbi:hypothetical protein SNEBB_010197 [Seison nebaliae]|nr:hypothetical protein SNEBB_010197 [Seison nebaliae]